MRKSQCRPDKAAGSGKTQERSTTSATGTSSIRVQELLERLTLHLHLGAAASGRRQPRDDFRFPLNHLGIRACIPLGNRFLDKLDSAIQLLIRHVLDRIVVLDLVLARDKQGETSQVHPGLLARM